jgi:hypothetical protein
MAILGLRGGTDGIPNMMFTQDTTYTPVKTLQAYVYVIGGGASGGYAGNWNTAASAGHSGGGGGAGGCAVSLLKLTTGVAYTADIGAGGARVGTGASDGSDFARGNAGVDTTFNGSDIDIMTGGGAPQGADNTNGANLTTASNGGSASGGNLMNNTGGKGKAVGAIKSITGGGAVGLWGTGNDSTTTSASSGEIADGGNLTGAPHNKTAGTLDENGAGWGFVTGAPFPDIYGVTSSYHRSGGDWNETAGSTADVDVNPQAIKAGVQPYNYRAESVRWEDNARSNPAPPFSGGVGMWNSTHPAVHAGMGTLGGGGGGCASFGPGTTSTGRSGMGGHGAVLIFPISLG